jgi:low temperature requirement protein LtrA
MTKGNHVPGRLQGPTTRPDVADSADDELRVSTLELFFDLVFVFTLTQLTGLLATDLSLIAVLHVVLIFTLLYWMYGGYVWLTNQVPPDRVGRRVLVVAGMVAFFVCALALPKAFNGGGVAFGLAYLLVILVHAGLWLQVYGAGVTLRFAPFNVLSGLLVTTAAFLRGPRAYVAWVVAIMIHFVSPRVAGRAAPRFALRSGHFVERHGLLLIVALGESVVAIGIGAAGSRLDIELFGAAASGLVLAATLWWVYFVEDEEGALRAMSNAPDSRRFVLAINAYFFAYIPILLGVIIAAAGVERSIGRASQRLDLGSALLLGVGVGMYLAGDVAFRHVMGIRPIRYRAGAAVATSTTVLLGIAVAGGVQLAALVGLVLGALLAEAWRPPSSGAAPADGRSDAPDAEPPSMARAEREGVASPAMNRKVQAYVFIDTENPGPKRVVKEIRALEGVVRADALLGTPDIVAIVEGDDIASMDAVIDGIAGLEGVLDTESKVARWID